MNLQAFLKSELNDRMARKGMLKGLWNLMFFPFTVIINLITYRKWMLLLKRLNLDERALGKAIPMKIQEESLPLDDKLKTLYKPRFPAQIDQGFLIERGELFVFPTYRSEFFTEIQEPVVVALSNAKHPYETLWELPTLAPVTEFQVRDSWTNITVKDPTVGHQIKLNIKKELDRPSFGQPGLGK